MALSGPELQNFAEHISQRQQKCNLHSCWSLSGGIHCVSWHLIKIIPIILHLLWWLLNTSVSQKLGFLVANPSLRHWKVRTCCWSNWLTVVLLRTTHLQLSEQTYAIDLSPSVTCPLKQGPPWEVSPASTTSSFPVFCHILRCKFNLQRERWEGILIL